MRSFLVTLAIWGGTFALLWLGAHELFYPPGDWIGALLASFFIALGSGSLRKAVIERRDGRIVARSGGAPRDGERVAIAGTVEPLGEILTAPLSGAPCVVYDYEISHVPKRSSDSDPRVQSTSNGPVVDRGGMALAPVVIRSGVREVRLLAYPGLEGFDSTEPADARARAHSYIAKTPFKDTSVFNVFSELSKVLDDRSGSVRVDWRNTSHDNLDDSSFKERCVPPGAKVCVVGRYSAKENAIVPQANVGGVRMIAGTREDALFHLKASGIVSIVGAVLLIALPPPIIFGVLTVRENYFEEHDEPSVKAERLEAFHAAVERGDLAAVNAAIARGVDVHKHDAKGQTALQLARNTAIATALLDAGAKVNAPDKRGYTPIMFTTRDEHVELMKLYIARGANVNARDGYLRMSPLEMAVHENQEKAAAVLRAAGAQ